MRMARYSLITVCECVCVRALKSDNNKQSNALTSAAAAVAAADEQCSVFILQHAF